MNTRANFIPDGFYHLYNQTNGGEALFKNDANRRFFLRRFCNFLKPFVYVHSYAMMQNHFHFSIQLKTLEGIKEGLGAMDKKELTVTLLKLRAKPDNSKLSVSCTDQELSDSFTSAIIEQFKRLFDSYTQSYNKVCNRIGSLFRQKIKRSHFDPDIKLHYLPYYIHHNARKHRVVKNFKEYPHTSYSEIINGESTFIDINKVYEWFSNEDDFIKFHTASQYEDVFKNLDLDEFVQ